MAVIGAMLKAEVLVVGEPAQIAAIDRASAAEVSLVDAAEVAIAAEVDAAARIAEITGSLPMVSISYADEVTVSTAAWPASAAFVGQPAATMVALVDSDVVLPVPSLGLGSSETTASLNLVVPFAVLQATGAGGNVALPPEGSLEFDEPTPSIELSIPFVSLL